MCVVDIVRRPTESSRTPLRSSAYADKATGFWCFFLHRRAYFSHGHARCAKNETTHALVCACGPAAPENADKKHQTQQIALSDAPSSDEDSDRPSSPKRARKDPPQVVRPQNLKLMRGAPACTCTRKHKGKGCPPRGGTPCPLRDFCEQKRAKYYSECPACICGFKGGRCSKAKSTCCPHRKWLVREGYCDPISFSNWYRAEKG